MTRDELRLEVLKLVNRHDLSPEVLLERAKAFEAYIAGEVVETDVVERPRRGRPPKSITIDPLG